MIWFQANPDRTLSAMPPRWQHQFALHHSGIGGRLMLARTAMMARSPEDAPQVVNLHRADECEMPPAQPKDKYRHAKKPERKGQRRTVTHQPERPARRKDGHYSDRSTLARRTSAIVNRQMKGKTQSSVSAVSGTRRPLRLAE